MAPLSLGTMPGNSYAKKHEDMEALKPSLSLQLSVSSQLKVVFSQVFLLVWESNSNYIENQTEAFYEAGFLWLLLKNLRTIYPTPHTPRPMSPWDQVHGSHWSRECVSAAKMKEERRDREGTSLDIFSPETWGIQGHLFCYCSHRYSVSADGYLRIQAVQVTDTGRYLCVATSAAGTDRRRTDLQVHGM